MFSLFGWKLSGFYDFFRFMFAGAVKMSAEEGGSPGGFGGSDVFGGSLGHDGSAVFTTFWADIDEIVRFG